MKKSWIVAKHEFLVTVKRVWFIVATFVFPLIMLGVTGAMMWLTHSTIQQSQKDVQSKALGVVDLWGGLKQAPAGEDLRLMRFATEKEAKAELIRKGTEIAFYIVVPEDYLEKESRIKVVTSRRPTLFSVDQLDLPRGVNAWLIDNVLSDVDERRLRRAKHPFPGRQTKEFLDAEGNPSKEDPEEVLKRVVVAGAFFVLLLVAIFTSSHYLLSGMAEEKEHRVMEMVLSSITPMELMIGKLIGLGAAGLLQLFIWVSMGGVVVVVLAVEIVLVPGAFFLGLLFFLLGYVLYGSLMLGFGALGTNFKESQQMASLWSVIGSSPYFVIFVLIEDPQGVLARVFSYIPFTAPTTVMFRYALDPAGMPVLDIVLPAAILAATTWLAILLSARLYRAGLLLYGKRPGIREIWRWILAAK